MTEEDREYSFQRLFTRRGSVLEYPPGNPINLDNNNIAARQIEIGKKLFIICLRFFKDEKFTGKLKEHGHNYLNNNEKACLDYTLSDEQKFLFLHNLFDEEAEQFYRDTIDHTCLTYSDANKCKTTGLVMFINCLNQCVSRV